MRTPLIETLAQRTKNLLLVILSLLFVCVLLWIVLSLFSSQQSSKVPDSATKLAEPLNPVLDTSKLNTIQSKRYYAPEELQSFPINIIETDQKTRVKRVEQIPPP